MLSTLISAAFIQCLFLSGDTSSGSVRRQKLLFLNSAELKIHARAE